MAMEEGWLEHLPSCRRQPSSNFQEKCFHSLRHHLFQNATYLTHAVLSNLTFMHTIILSVEFFFRVEIPRRNYQTVKHGKS